MNAKSEREARIRLCALKQQYRRAWQDPKSSPCFLAQLLMQVEAAASGSTSRTKGNIHAKN